MLHWLRQRWTRYTSLKAFFVYVSLSHVIFCGILFFVYKSGPDFSFSISKNSPAAVIRLLPLGACKPSVTVAAKKIKSGKKNNNSSKAVVQKKQPKVQKKQPKKTALVQEKKNKKSQDKKKQKSLQDEVVVEESLVEKKPEEITQLEKKAEEQPKVQEVKVVEPLVDSSAQVAQESQEIVYVTQKELDVLQLQQQLKEAIEAVWTSPFGMAEDVVCEVLIVIGWDGNIVERSLTQPTDIYIYDRAVEEALDKLTFPQQLWGKTIAIAFKP